MTTYQWDVEVLDADGDIVDHDFADSAADALAIAARHKSQGTRARVVLVRDSEKDGRSWAYTVGGLLPTHFEDAYLRTFGRVPARFHDELRKAWAR